MTRLDWGDLQYVVAAARAGSLTGAARQLGVAVTTVRSRLASFEKATGTRLFHRTRDGLKPTRAAGPVLEAAEAVVEPVERVRRALRAGEEAIAGEVTVSCTDAVAVDVIAPRLGPLLARHPGLTVALRAEGRMVSLAKGEADLAIRTASSGEATSLRRRLATVRVGPFCSKAYARKHKLVARRMPANGQGLDLLILDDRWSAESTTLWITQRLAGARVALKGSSLRILAAAMEGGAGIAMLPHFGAGPDWVPLTPPDALPAAELWLVAHPEAARGAAVRAVIDHLVASFTLLR